MSSGVKDDPRPRSRIVSAFGFKARLPTIFHLPTNVAGFRAVARSSFGIFVSGILI